MAKHNFPFCHGPEGCWTPIALPGGAIDGQSLVYSKDSPLQLEWGPIAKGDRGEAGPQGTPGRDGIDGTNGLNGLPGTPGRDGATGPTGPAGRDGVDGRDGRDGQNGKNGETPRIGPNDTWIIGSFDTTMPTKGRDGIDGKNGLMGPIGPPGPAGLQGAQGPPGPMGMPGAKGDKGDTGNTGPMGPQGEKGDSGGEVKPTTAGWVVPPEVKPFDGFNNTFSLNNVPKFELNVYILKPDDSFFMLQAGDYSINGNNITIIRPILEAGDRMKIIYAI